MFFSSNKPTDRVSSDIKQLLSDLSGLLSSKELDAIPQFRDVREKLSEGISHARETMVQAAEDSAARTREIARAGNEYAHEEPWRIAGTAFALGALMAFCLSRR